MRILVTGSRNWNNYNVVMRGLTVAIDELVSAFPDDKEIVVVHGGAKGADTMASDYVLHARKFLLTQGYTIREEPHYPDYPTYGRYKAPKMRNQAMVDSGADICLVFNRNNSGGTADCKARAEAAEIMIKEFKSA